MKRKLRIFSNIAIICLSVCMFAFGVYAASTVSVTTSGTVTFNATGVYARVQRTVTGTAETVADFDKTIDSSSTSPVKVTELAENLTFANPNFPIIMTFTITNLAEDRNLDFTFTGFNNGVEEGLDGNVAAYYTCSTDKYSGEKYNIHPMTDGLNNVETITISFYVIDANKSASLEYDYALNLTNQDIVLKDNLPITVNDTSTTKNSTARVVKKVGNTVILGATLNSDSQFLDFEITGASTVKHYAPTLVDNEIQKPLLVVDANATGYVSKVEGLNTRVYDYSDIENNTILPAENLYEIENIQLIFPISVRHSGETSIITTIGGSGFYNGVSIVFPSSITTLLYDSFNYPYYLKSITEYGTIKNFEACNFYNSCVGTDVQFKDNETGITYTKTSNNNYWASYSFDWTAAQYEVYYLQDGCQFAGAMSISGPWYPKFWYFPGSLKAFNYQSFAMADENYPMHFILPSSVTSFSAANPDDLKWSVGAFSEYGSVPIETITFSNTVTSTFANDSFKTLEGYLKTINFVGTRTEWNALKNIENAGIPSGVRINCLDESFTIA